MKEKIKKYTWRNYPDYIKDNPKGYWFKRKLYGWGWFPVTWQGITITLGFILLLMLNGFYLEYKVLTEGNPTNADLTIFLCVIFLSIITILWICFVKGEKPGWNWGILKCFFL